MIFHLWLLTDLSFLHSILGRIDWHTDSANLLHQSHHGYPGFSCWLFSLPYLSSMLFNWVSHFCSIIQFFPFPSLGPKDRTFREWLSKYKCNHFLAEFREAQTLSCCSVTKLLWPHEQQHTRLPCPSPSPGVCSNSCPRIQWCYLTISSSAAHFSFAFTLSQHQGAFQWVGCSHQLAKVLELQL